MLAATSSPSSNTTNGMPRSWRWAAAARPTGPAPITATGRLVGFIGVVSSNWGSWCWLRRTVRGWDAFRGMLRPSPPASVSMTMGMTMTLDRKTDHSTDLDTIWGEVGASIERFVRRRISDPHQADDVVAEVMLRIHQNLGTLDDQERVTAWVFRVTRNAITDHYRRSGRRREVLAAEIEAIADPSADAWLDDQEATLSELAACIRPLVDALPPDYRRALELTDFQGHTQADA